LAEDSFLTDDFLRQLINVGEVDILVGLPPTIMPKLSGPDRPIYPSGILRDFPESALPSLMPTEDRGMELLSWYGLSIDDVRARQPVHAAYPATPISTSTRTLRQAGVRELFCPRRSCYAQACVLSPPSLKHQAPNGLQLSEANL